MHSWELDIGRVFKALVFTLCCGFLMLVPHPIQAQTATSTPPSPSSTLVQDLSTAAQTLGATTVINTGIVVLLVIVAWRGLAPLISTITRLLDTVRDTQKALDDERQERQYITQKLSTALTDQSKAQSDAADQRARTTDAQERMANILTTLETDEKAGQRQQAIQDNSNRARDAINQHTDESIQPVKVAADNTLTKLTEVEQRLDTLATKTDLQEEVKPLRESIERLREAIEHQLLPIVPPMQLPSITPPQEPSVSGS